MNFISLVKVSIKIQHSFMIMTLNKLGIDYFFNFLKDICDKTRADILLTDRRLNAFSLRSGIRQVFVFTTAECCTGYSIQRNQARKKKDTQIRRKEIKLFLFAGDIILYLENPKKKIFLNEQNRQIPGDRKKH